MSEPKQTAPTQCFDRSKDGIYRYMMERCRILGPEIAHCPECRRGACEYTYAGSKCLNCKKGNR